MVNLANRSESRFAAGQKNKNTFPLCTKSPAAATPMSPSSTDTVTGTRPTSITSRVAARHRLSVPCISAMSTSPFGSASICNGS